METILVPTDFSSNAMAGVRFAINLAARMTAKLRFVYVHSATGKMAQEKIAVNSVETDVQNQQAFYLTKLQELVEKAYGEMALQPVPYSCVFIVGCQAYQSLLEYMAEHVDIKYIVMGAQGADNRRDGSFGTNTDKLIIKSEVPVIAISSRN